MGLPHECVGATMSSHSSLLALEQTQAMQATTPKMGVRQSKELAGDQPKKWREPDPRTGGTGSCLAKTAGAELWQASSLETWLRHTVKGASPKLDRVGAPCFLK